MRRAWFLLGILLAAPFAWPEGGSARIGFRIDLDAGGSYAPSYGADQSPLAAGERSFGLGTELLRGRWIALRSELDLFWIGASAWSEDLFRYRAFHGARWAAESGARLPLGQLELDLLAGGALSAARYDGESIVTAYPSIVAEAQLLAPIAIRGLPGFSACAAIPLEYLFRGTARTFSAGLELGAAFALGGAAK